VHGGADDAADVIGVDHGYSLFLSGVPPQARWRESIVRISPWPEMNAPCWENAEQARKPVAPGRLAPSERRELPRLLSDRESPTGREQQRRSPPAPSVREHVANVRVRSKALLPLQAARRDRSAHVGEQARKLLADRTGGLLPATTRGVLALYRPLLEPYRLTHPQYVAMLALDDGEAHSVSALAEQLLLTVGTMSPLLQRLAALGYISRPRDRSDERRLAVTLTETGRDLIPELRLISGQIQEHIGLTDRDREHLHRFIDSVRHDTTPTVH
jgi:DNA-binding MarR family transcriptional regulator